MTTKTNTTQRERMQKFYGMFEDYKSMHNAVDEFTEFIDFSAIMFAFELSSDNAFGFDDLRGFSPTNNPFIGSIAAIFGYCSEFKYYDYIKFNKSKKNMPVSRNGNPNCMITDYYLSLSDENINNRLTRVALKTIRELVDLNTKLHAVGMPKVLTKKLRLTDQSSSNAKYYYIEDCFKICREIIDTFPRFSSKRTELPAVACYTVRSN